MRVEGHIPHPKLQITVFRMNDKFIVKFEAAGMEQAIRFGTDEVNGMEEIKARIDEEFLAGVIRRFNEMFTDLKRLRDKA